MTKQHGKKLTIQESIELTGKSNSTLRRMIKGLSDVETSQYISREQGKILIDKAWLVKKYNLTSQPAKSDTQENIPNETKETQDTAPNDMSKLVVLLENQLEIKDKQISDLTERNRELNILLKNEQETTKTLLQNQNEVIEPPTTNHQPTQPETVQSIFSGISNGQTLVLMVFMFVSVIVVAYILLS